MGLYVEAEIEGVIAQDVAVLPRSVLRGRSQVLVVTPEDRHEGRDVETLEKRRRVYERARSRHPERWSGEIRDWTPLGAIVLNPDNPKTVDETGRILVA